MRESLSKRAIAAFGPHAQLDMCVEECAELIAAINRLRRGRISADEVAQEVADVMIVIEQARLIIGQESVDIWVERKLDRLESRLLIAESSK